MGRVAKGEGGAGQTHIGAAGGGGGGAGGGAGRGFAGYRWRVRAWRLGAELAGKVEGVGGLGLRRPRVVGDGRGRRRRGRPHLLVAGVEATRERASFLLVAPWSYVRVAHRRRPGPRPLSGGSTGVCLGPGRLPLQGGQPDSPAPTGGRAGPPTKAEGRLRAGGARRLGRRACARGHGSQRRLAFEHLTVAKTDRPASLMYRAGAIPSSRAPAGAAAAGLRGQVRSWRHARRRPAAYRRALAHARGDPQRLPGGRAARPWACPRQRRRFASVPKRREGDASAAWRRRGRGSRTGPFHCSFTAGRQWLMNHPGRPCWRAPALPHARKLRCLLPTLLRTAVAEAMPLPTRR
jgi:hypothetical protein